ncbi:MAG: shikimate kinase [Candidatus Nanohalobium sp.]
MVKTGKAKAPGALTIINAIAALRGSAFAIDLYTEAKVEIDKEKDGITGDIEGDSQEDTEMIERCVQLVLEEFDIDAGAHVSTSSEIPMASGLKSSSAAANAATLATLDAIDEEKDEVEATRIGVQASVDAGVTVTGAMDDAAASMLGGVVMTDNSENKLVKHEDFDYHCAVYIPDEKARSVDTDIDRSKLVDTVVDQAFENAVEGNYEAAMTTNGFAYCAALDFEEEIIMEALEHAPAASLSGTGPSFGAIGTREEVEKVAEEWRERPGEVLILETVNEGGEKL